MDTEELRSRTSQSLADFIDSSPSMIQAESLIRRRLVEAGAIVLDEQVPWNLEPGTIHVVSREQSALIAFRLGEDAPDQSGFRVASAHTDSPMLKLKAASGVSELGYSIMSTEVYGAPILSTWLDRDFGLAGYANLRSGASISSRPFSLAKPAFCIPNLAIHLNREINKGFEYNPQDHLRAICLADVPEQWATKPAHFLISQELGVDPQSVVGGDWYLAPLEAARWNDAGMFSAARIDNLAGCHSVLRGFLEARPGAATQVAVFYNHEEIGSASTQGAAAAFFVNTLRRILAVTGANQEAEYLAASKSFQVSVDAAHAWHPNFPSKFDPAYRPALGKGLVVKQSATQRYATNPRTEGMAELLAGDAGIDLQYMTNRSDIPSGSTIGPLSATRADIATVDVGIPIFAMHSIREVCSVIDQSSTIRFLTKHFESEP